MKLQKISNIKLQNLNFEFKNNSKLNFAKQKYNNNSINLNSASAILNRQNVLFCGAENLRLLEKEAKIEKAKSEIAEYIANKDNIQYDKILSHLGFGVEEDEDGLLILDKYHQPKDFKLSDLGIDEDDMFKHIKEIKGNADFKYSGLTSLENLELINGHADFRQSKITSLSNLRKIGMDADFKFSQITSLNNLESIGRNADFRESKLISLGNLKTIEGSAYFRNSVIKSLGNLKFIGEDANFSESELTSLGDLKTIGGNADFSDSKITSLNNLESIGGDADFRNSELSSLSNIKKIGGRIYFIGSNIPFREIWQFKHQRNK